MVYTGHFTTDFTLPVGMVYTGHFTTDFTLPVGMVYTGHFTTDFTLPVGMVYTGHFTTDFTLPVGMVYTGHFTTDFTLPVGMGVTWVLYPLPGPVQLPGNGIIRCQVDVTDPVLIKTVCSEDLDLHFNLHRFMCKGVTNNRSNYHNLSPPPPPPLSLSLSLVEAGCLQGILPHVQL